MIHDRKYGFVWKFLSKHIFHHFLNISDLSLNLFSLYKFTFTINTLDKFIYIIVFVKNKIISRIIILKNVMFAYITDWTNLNIFIRSHLKFAKGTFISCIWNPYILLSDERN